MLQVLLVFVPLMSRNLYAPVENHLCTLPVNIIAGLQPPYIDEKMAPPARLALAP